jgi:hypothetical protein
MDAELLAIIIPGAIAVSGSIATAGRTWFKYRQAKKKEIEAEKRQFYLYTASNIVRESERLFGDGRGEEKKQYAMTRLQNEALASGIEWNPKMASISIEQAVTFSNDYKNMEIPISDLIKKETEVDQKEIQNLELEIEKDIDEITNVSKKIAKDIIVKVKPELADEVDDSVIGVSED